MTSQPNGLADGATALRIDDVSLSTAGASPRRPGRPLLRHVGLEVRTGEVVGLTGPSGAGKSTLLRAACGLHRVDGGSIRVAGAPVSVRSSGRSRPSDGRVGLIFQSPRAAMDGHLNLARSINAAADLAAHRGAASSEWNLEEEADRLGLTPALLARTPDAVSDGQLQRAALLRALAQAPRVLLCDEITAALDPRSSQLVMHRLVGWARESGGAVLMASHHLRLLDEHTHRQLSVSAWAVKED